MKMAGSLVLPAILAFSIGPSRLRRNRRLLLRRGVTTRGLRCAGRLLALRSRCRGGSAILVAGRLPWLFRRASRGGCRVVALQLEVDGRNFKRHLVAWIHGRIALRIQHMHAIIPWIGLEPAS